MISRIDQLNSNQGVNPLEFKVTLIIPTRNASLHWQALQEGISNQSLQPHEVIIIDSSSSDDTVANAQRAGFTVIQIDSRDFNHGGTRELAAEHASQADILIYLTQDAIPRGTNAFENIVAVFADSAVGAAYGRQLPRPSAGAIESHARLFNYPAVSSMRAWDSKAALGFKSIFFSNSFGAYRREALASVGGFSSDVIFGEDTVAVAKLHRAGWKTAYVADAEVEHSHAFSMREEFKRYFDIGVLHAREPWLVEQFGTASGEGRRFVLSELRYLLSHNPFLIPSAMMRTLTKYVGYRMGKLEKIFSPRIKSRLGLNKAYWSR